MRDYSQLTSEKKIAFLDQSIDKMEVRMKEWRSRRVEIERQQNSSDGTTKKDGNRGRRGSRNMSKEDKENRKRNRLDSSTPEERALFSAFIMDMKKRRKERGLSPMSRGGFGPPR